MYNTVYGQINLEKLNNIIEKANQPMTVRERELQQLMLDRVKKYQDQVVAVE